MAKTISTVLAATIVLAAVSPGRSEPASSRPELGTLHFIDVPELTASIVDGPRSVGVLHVRLNVQAANDADAALLQARGPELRQALLMAVTDFASLYASPAGPVDARLLTTSLDDRLEEEGFRGQVRLIELSARSH